MLSKKSTVNSDVPFLEHFAARFVEERRRLGLTQLDIREHCDVGRSTQVKYESGDSAPDVRYLVKISELGFDLLYLLTGERNSTVLPREQQNLLSAYAQADDATKDAVFGVLLAKHSPEVKAARASVAENENAGQLPGEVKLTYKQGPTPTRLLQDGDPEAKDGPSGEK